MHDFTYFEKLLDKKCFIDTSYNKQTSELSGTTLHIQLFGYDSLGSERGSRGLDVPKSILSSCSDRSYSGSVQSQH